MSKTKRTIEQINKEGINFFNKILPKFSSSNDVYTEMFKNLLLFVSIFSVFMMFAHPVGWLYACFPRPFSMAISWLMGIHNFKSPTPEWGIHYITLCVYSLAGYLSICYMEKQGIDKPINKVGYVFFLIVLSLYVPFELFYITLYDIFHSIPKFGTPLIWLFGYWNPPLKFLIESVIVMDVGVPILCLGGMYVLYDDLKDYFNIRMVTFDNKSRLYFMFFLLFMFLWVIMPYNYPEINFPEWGTNIFPQTIYVDYGYYEDYNITYHPEGEIWGIVKEYWYPNDLVKYHNHVAKLFSVLFMFHTFTPRIIKEDDKNITKK